MHAQIRPNRLEVNDRFPMLGFTIRANAPDMRAEVVLATSPDLLTAAGKGRRTASNFFSSRATGELTVPRGEAVWVVPPEILARFIGTERLYFGLAAAPSGGPMAVAVMPTEASPYVSLRGLTGRSLRRVRVLPGRARVFRDGIDWAGDVEQPGQRSTSAAPLPSPAPAEPEPYDDGFGPMPPASEGAPVAAHTPALVTPPAAAAQSLGQRRGATRARASALEIVTERQPVSPPPVTVLEGAQKAALETGLTLLAGPAAPGIIALRLAARASGAAGAPISIGVGPTVGAGLLGGGTLGAGVIFGPDGELGLYGVAQLDLGLLASISVQMQVTVVRGGVASFNGWSRAATIAVGEGTVGGVSALFDEAGNFQGISMQLGVGAGLSPVEVYLSVQRQVATQLGMAAALGRLAPARAFGIDADPLTVELKYRMFIPSPAIDAPFAAFGGDGRGFSYADGTSRGEITARVRLDMQSGIESIEIVDAHWGESTEYDADDVFHPDGKPDWWHEKQPGAQPTARKTLGRTSDNLNVVRGAPGMTLDIEAMAERAALLTVTAAGGLPLSKTAPDIDAEVSVMLRVSGDVVEAKVAGSHDGFPCHELYINGQRVYTYDPVAAGNDPTSLFPPQDIEVRTGWITVARIGVPVQAMAARPKARAFDAAIPLDPGIGGLSISLEALQPGDIILSTTDAAISRLIRFGTGGQVSHAMLYVDQGGQVIEAVGQGVILRPIAEALNAATVAVAFRVPDLTPDQRRMVAEEAARRIDLPYNTMGIVRQAVFQVDQRICAALPNGLADKCRAFAGRIDLGTADSSSFFCSQLVLDAYQAAGIPLTTEPPQWASPDDLAEWRFDLTKLRYVGHLKAAPSGGLFGHVLSAAASAATAPAEEFSLNWDEVQLVPQPTDVTCWAAAAAMVVGWRDRISLTPESLVAICGRSTGAGLPLSDVGKFAEEMSLVAEPPVSYSEEGFRRLLESSGPLWVAAKVPGIHAIVVTGMYRQGGRSFVRISDPWDRQVGTPGAPGAYASTHVTGSRYIMSWEAFTAEYEELGRNPSAGLQVLHGGSSGGREPNRGSARAAGYAQALGRSRRPPAAPPPSAGRVRAMGAEPPALKRRTETTRREGVVFELEQADGLRVPSSMAMTGSQLETEARLAVEDWPRMPDEHGGTFGGVEIAWRHGSGALGDVRVMPTRAGTADGYALSVTGRVLDGPDTASVAGLTVELRHAFTREGEPRQVSRITVRLLGDGRHERQNAWEPAEEPVTA
ncbi:MAG: papain-like cysteine protease family protein [Hyphomicrobiaceae bacterium]